MTPQVSLALVTYNQAGLLEAFLANYLRDGASLLPLIVVDDGSEDRTPEILGRLPRGSPVTFHRLAHVSAAHARNHALRLANAPWLAFSDTDCLLDRGYFETLATLPYRFPGAPAVEGAVRPPPGPKPPFTHSLFNPSGGTYATANMVFHVPSTLAVGGFDEGFGVNYREDTDLALTLMDRLGPIPFFPELVVIHPHVPRSFAAALGKAFAGQRRLIEAEMRLFEKHPASYRRVRHYRDAYGTLMAWCLKYAGLYGKECLRYLFLTPGLTWRDRMRGLGLSALALAVALWEQACTLWLCLERWKRISRLRMP